MKTTTLIIALLLPAFYLAAQTTVTTDTTFRYNNRSVVVNEKNNEINVSVYRLNEQGDSIKSEKMYEGIFTDGRTVERTYDNNFVISVPDIFKPKSKRQTSDTHWAGFGVGFSNIPEGFNFDGELASALNVARSLQYNLNFIDGYWFLGKSNVKLVTGFGIQFNSMHFQTNKFIEVKDYKSEITTVTPGQEYNTSRLHYTHLTFPLLFETDWYIGRGSHFFINAGIVAKVKTASSSKVWFNENGKEKKLKKPGELNIRPVTFDFLLQAGIDNIGFFASYSPMNVFLNGKGPKGNQGTIGLQFYF